MPAQRWFLPGLLSGVVVGILAADARLGPPPTAGLAAGALVLVAALRWWGLLPMAAVLLGLGAGAWRADGAMATWVGSPRSVAALVDGAERTVVGTVVDDPRPREDRVQLVLGELRTAAPDGSVAALDDALLVWLPRGIEVAAGDTLRISARFELPRDFEGFAYREYLARQGVGAIARPRAVETVGREDGPRVALASFRASLLRGLNGLVPEPEAALGAGILLGVRAAIAPEINDAFARAGLTHVVAISGWNIAIVAAMVMAMVRPLERRAGGRWTTAAIAVATVGGYVALTGSSPSVVRAALMALCLLVARSRGSRTHAASALGLAALAMLLAAPPVLWDVGFQLSLLATGGLIWFGGPIERRLAGWPMLVREPVALTFAAQVTTLPVILVNFERLSLVAPVANVLVVPFVPLAMAASAAAAIIGALLSVLSPPVVSDLAGWATGGFAWLTLRIIVALGSAAASVPFASVDVSVPPVLAITWLPIVGLARWAVADREGRSEAAGERPGPPALVRRALRPVPLSTTVVAVLTVLTVLTGPDGRLHVTVLDVGQGDAILIEGGSGATMLVDGGPDPERTLRRIGANLPFHARRIDVLVVSHPHQDHVAGLVDVLERFRVGAVVHAAIPFDNPAYARLLAEASAAGTPVATAASGTRIALDATTSVEVIYPSPEEAAAPLPDGDINNGSLVMVVRHGSFAALLTGDAESPVEAALASEGRLPAVDVLKVGHHGSTSSTTGPLLAATKPALSAISVGTGNDYGHPAQETVEALARAGVVVLRTDLHGDIEIETDGASYRV